MRGRGDLPAVDEHLLRVGVHAEDLLAELGHLVGGRGLPQPAKVSEFLRRRVDMSLPRRR